MRFRRFSPRQRQVLTWWCGPETRDREAIICDGAVRSGKTLCLGLSFFCWAMGTFRGQRFGLCGKTAVSLRRNLLETVRPALEELGFRWEERVSRNQVEMLRALGMLQDNAYDYSVYAGAALLVAAGMAVLLALLRLLDQQLLHDLRGLMVLMTVLVITMGLCMLCVKGLNAYLAPITMAAMMLTGLLGVPVGIASIAPMALMVSGVTAGGNGNYSTEMVHRQRYAVSGIPAGKAPACPRGGMRPGGGNQQRSATGGHGADDVQCHGWRGQQRGLGHGRRYGQRLDGPGAATRF